MTTTWNPVSDPNTLTWSDVPKAQATTSVITDVFTGGEPIGLLLALTYSTVSQTSVVTGIWNPLTKTIGTPWTAIPKAT